MPGGGVTPRASALPSRGIPARFSSARTGCGSPDIASAVARTRSTAPATASPSASHRSIANASGDRTRSPSAAASPRGKSRRFDVTSTSAPASDAAASTWTSSASRSHIRAIVASPGRTSAPGQAARRSAISPRATASPPATLRAARAHSSSTRGDQSGQYVPAPAIPSSTSRITVG